MQVCVPFLASDALLFDPEAVPTVAQLLDELSAERALREVQPDSAIAKGQGWQHTSLAACMSNFIKIFLEPLRAAGREELAIRARQSATRPTLAW